MTLKENLIAGLRFVLRFEKVIETDFKQRRRRSVSGKMSAHAAARRIDDFVGANHHRHRVVAHQAFDATFQLAVARKLDLFRHMNGVDVRRRGGERNAHAVALRVDFQFVEQLLHALGAFGLQHEVQ